MNHSAYLKDETGGRRFWPATCGKIDLDALARDRDQLWAEAVVRYRAGDEWWLGSEELNREAEIEQVSRYQGDVWDEPIREYLEQHDDVSITEVLNYLGLPRERCGHAEAARVGRSLVALGWERYYSGRRGARQWRYRPCPKRVETKEA